MTRRELNEAFSQIKMSDNLSGRIVNGAVRMHRKRKEKKKMLNFAIRRGFPAIAAAGALGAVILFGTGTLQDKHGALVEPVTLETPIKAENTGITEAITAENQPSEAQAEPRTGSGDIDAAAPSAGMLMDTAADRRSGLIDLSAITPALNETQALLTDLAARLYLQETDSIAAYLESMKNRNRLPKGMEASDIAQMMDDLLSAPTEIWLIDCNAQLYKDMGLKQFEEEGLEQVFVEEIFLDRLEINPLSKMLARVRRIDGEHSGTSYVFREPHTVSMRDATGEDTDDLMIAFAWNPSGEADDDQWYFYCEFSSSYDDTMTVSFGFDTDTALFAESETGDMAAFGIQPRRFAYDSDVWMNH